ncbi:Adaptive-response sensory-kinase SasA [bioreactor metagenome]|uniref:histidine kinase n=1 Tax=bioreactor metagenome TaxID=1076179 RepID=A0A644U7W3_9ZZZZ|nr:ATP-binding protein [Negativicutes bacterium]
MFQRTLRHLSATNSLVFLLIFVVFGTVIYGFVSFRLFDKVDEAAFLKASNFKIANGRPAPQGRARFLFDPRIIILLRDSDNTVHSAFPSREVEVERLTEIVAPVRTGEIVTKDFDDHFYRIVDIPYRYDDVTFNTENGLVTITGVIAVSIVDSEMALLHNLLIIIVGGLVIGLLIIILAGYYLARRAMIPIQGAWDKQQEFVADASHELRTPLAVVKSNAELILRHPDHTVEEESIRVTNIIREVRRMTKLVSDLLTLARADASQSELQFGEVSLNELLQTLGEQFAPLAEIEGHTMKVEVVERLELIADRERLYQLLVILTDNAFKYTSPPGTIIISGARQGGNILVTVEDSGQGIAPNDVPRVFDRFYRGDKARTREKGGTGLGLSIAKWIVEKHGGKITVESQQGIGTKFSIVLPAKLATKKVNLTISK